MLGKVEQMSSPAGNQRKEESGLEGATLPHESPTKRRRRRRICLSPLLINSHAGKEEKGGKRKQSNNDGFPSVLGGGIFVATAELLKLFFCHRGCSLHLLCGHLSPVDKKGKKKPLFSFLTRVAFGRIIMLALSSSHTPTGLLNLQA